MKSRYLLPAFTSLFTLQPVLASDIEPRIGVQLWSVRDDVARDFDHHQEFAAFGETTYWDYIASRTDGLAPMDALSLSVKGHHEERSSGNTGEPK